MYICIYCMWYVYMYILTFLSQTSIDSSYTAIKQVGFGYQKANLKAVYVCEDKSTYETS